MSENGTKDKFRVLLDIVVVKREHNDVRGVVVVAVAANEPRVVGVDKVRNKMT